MNHIKVRMCVRKCPHGLPWVGCISKSKSARAECKGKTCFPALLRRSRFSRQSLKERFRKFSGAKVEFDWFRAKCPATFYPMFFN